MKDYPDRLYARLPEFEGYGLEAGKVHLMERDLATDYYHRTVEEINPNGRDKRYYVYSKYLDIVENKSDNFKSLYEKLSY